MKLLLQRYVSAFAIVWIAFGGYALLAVPRIEPSVRLRTTDASYDAPQDTTTGLMQQHREKVEHLFPPGSWQLQNPKVLETEHGTLVFKDYKPLPDGRMELKPLTLIVYAGSNTQGKAPPRPLLLDAPDGAILQFDAATDPARADFGRLTGGLLAGEIRIYSPPTTPAANDALQITTRNVQLDERRIWTPHAVNFRYGPSYGSGRDLVVTLTPAEKGGKRRSGPAIEGVKTLELVHVDKFHFEMTADTALPGKKLVKPVSGAVPAPKPLPAPVEVTCQGPFLFDFEQHIASFEDAVDVIRLNPDGPSDQLTCQLLSIYLRPKGSTGESAAETTDKPKTNLALEVDRVVAVGHPVVLRAPSMGATARGQRLEYHFNTRRVVLADNDRVTLHDERFDVEARQIEYEMAESGGLGRMWAAGPGNLRVRKAEGLAKKTTGRLRAPIAPIAARADSNAPAMFVASWQKELRLRPHQGQHVVSLIEGASVNVPLTGGFNADEIHLWLNEIPRAPSATKSSNKPQFGSGKFEIQPDRMLALGHVKILAEQLDGDTGRLEVWFRNSPAAATTTAAATESTQSPLLPTRTTDPTAAAKPAAQKFKLWGDLVRIEISRQGEITALKEVSVDGKVRLEEQPPPGTEAVAPLVITGNTLQLEGGLEKDAVVVVLGEPAVVAARGTTMRGSNIHLHRGDNLAWIEGPGEMLLPLARDLNGAKVERPTNVAVTWQTGLEFDGQLAHFAGNVEARTDQQWARGDALDVTLVERLDFMQTKSTSEPKVEAIEFNGHFAMENRSFDKRKQLASIEKMEAVSLRVEQQSGNMRAAGPGWVSTVRLGGSNNPLAARLNPAASPKPAAPTSTEPQFTYLFAEFQLQIEGNFYQRQVEFQRHVRAVYGPVTGWDKTLDIDRPELLEEGGVLMNCQRLTLREMPGSTRDSTSLEMEATGDTVVEGRGFTARAARIGYVDEKQLLVLEGDGRRDAELSRQTRIGGPQSHLSARKIMYWRFDNRVEVDDARSLEFNALGGGLTLPK